MGGISFGLVHRPVEKNLNRQVPYAFGAVAWSEVDLFSAYRSNAQQAVGVAFFGGHAYAGGVYRQTEDVEKLKQMQKQHMRRKMSKERQKGKEGEEEEERGREETARRRNKPKQGGNGELSNSRK